MSHFKDKITRTTRHLALALLASFVLTSCGGGGGGGNATGVTPSVNSIEGSVVAGVTVLSATQNNQIQSVQRNTDGSLIVTGTAGSLDQMKVGQIVTIPVNATQGLPYGYAGKVVTLPGSNQLQLAPAAVEDVFQKLKIDVDTARDGATVAGIVVAPGATASFTQSAGTQAGLTSTSCVSTQTGLTVTGGIKCANGLLSGEIKISQDFTLKKKGSSTQTGKATLLGSIKLDNGRVTYQADFDPLKYVTNGGWATLKGVIKADISGSVGISTPETDGTPDSQLEIPAWSELLRADGKNIWDKSWTYGGFFELSGLNGDDKKGLIPLAGIIIAPTSPNGKPFTGDLSASQLGFYGASSAVILWVYIDASGSLTVSGEADLLRLDNMHVERGYQFQANGNQLVGLDINNNTAPTVTAPYIKGSATVTQTLGVDLVADVLVGGIRPMTIKAQAIAATLSSTIQGEGGYQWSPQQLWTGNLCYNSSAHVDSSLSVQARIKAKLDAGWLTRQGVAEYSNQWNKNWYTMPIASSCIGTSAADTTPPITTVAPSVSGTTSNATTLSVTINENGTGYYLVQPAATAAPSVAAVQAGTSFAMTQGVAATQNISGLTPSTAYKIYFVSKDAANNVQAAVQSVAVTTSAAADVTPPVTTAALSVYGITGTATTLSVTINENGTGYYLVQPAATAAPSVAAVRAGTSFAMTGNVAATKSIGGLTPSTMYKIYFVAKDAANNVQAAVQSVAFTTSAAADVTPPVTTAAPSVYGITGTATTLSVTINENGTGYYLVQLAAAATPSVAAVQVGTFFAMTGNVAATQSIGGLTPSTAYKIYFVAKDAANNVQAAVQSVAVTTSAAVPPPNGFTLSGYVIDENSNPINGATVALTANAVTYLATSDSTGAYYLHLSDQQASYLPAVFAVNAYEVLNHNPSSQSFVLATSNFVRTNFILLSISGNPQLISIELVPEVHHIGNSNFSGTENSQFQYPLAEGVAFQRSFSVNAQQKAFQTATITLNAKGIQCPDEIWINSTLLATLGNSDAGGAYTSYRIALSPSLFMLGNSNLFRFVSTSCGSDLDDFEFANVQIWFQ